MPILKLNDANIYYEAQGSGPPFLFLSETAGNSQRETWAPAGRVPSLFLYRAGGGP